MAATINDFHDGLTFTGAAGSDSPIKFSLLGGRYAAVLNATWSGGNVELDVFAPDGTTAVKVASWTADATEIIDLPPGRFQFQITTSTAVQVALVRVPLGRGA